MSIPDCWHGRTNMCVRTNICSKSGFVFSGRNINIFWRNLTQFTASSRIKSGAAKRCDPTERTGLEKSVSVAFRKSRLSNCIFLRHIFWAHWKSGNFGYQKVTMFSWNPPFFLSFFLSFFLGFRRPNLITGLSGWRASYTIFGIVTPFPFWIIRPKLT